MNKTKAGVLPIEQLKSFSGHPFQVRDDESMDELVESIRREGVMTPILVRPLDTGEYEIISGHRRVHACKKAGINQIPALIRELDRDAAAIALVDSNLHREHILPSEKAFAYKMKMEAMNRQGERTDLTSTQVVSKLRTNELVGHESGESREQVRRYIRLTNLIPEILQKVDDGQIALTPAVELSYLTKEEQTNLLETMECEDCTPSLSQAIALKKASQLGMLTMDMTYEILSRPKANQKEKISFKVDEIREYFPMGYTAAQMSREILAALEERQRRRKAWDRDER